MPLESLTTLDDSSLSNSSSPSLCVADRAPAYHPKPRPELRTRKLKQSDKRMKSLSWLFARKPARSCQKAWGPANNNTQKDKNQYQTDPQAAVCGDSHRLGRCRQLRPMWPIVRSQIGWWHRRSPIVKSLPLPGPRHQADCPALTSEIGYRMGAFRNLRLTRTSNEFVDSQRFNSVWCLFGVCLVSATLFQSSYRLSQKATWVLMSYVLWYILCLMTYVLPYVSWLMSYVSSDVWCHMLSWLWFMSCF